ncbi:MAG: UDP-N-acetylmuramoylalanyl-D-glutamyl-2,6-diaminopimelate--D-alanyl-D-alanine ligase [Parvibaculaceae bacterium]|nr:UDP-N-acetylmuramoylalanyl-D-glutamyl-2,6-diaminopimelate--D-alanyl-D-alanine ligase [Parvibaculaceae bacterium]
MSILWTANTVLAAVGGEATGRGWTVSGISIDSRTLEKGDLFVALDGENADGHVYVARAFANGATAALVSRPTDEMRALGPLVIVPDVLEALNALGRAARARSLAKVVAVTGSVGKTSTKEALRLVFEAQGRTHASVASYNNHWGVPLSLARMPASTEYAVFEIGMNHEGEITPLTQLVRPHVAIVTTVEAVHLAHFSSIDAIARAKAEIFTGIEPDGTAILNADNPHLDLLTREARAAGVEHILTFGEETGADVRLEKVALLENCSCVTANIDGVPVVYKVGVPGRHLVMNSLAVLAAVKAVGGDLALAAMALAQFAAPKGRGERHAIVTEGKRILLIDESYNANPASMKAAIAALGQAIPKGRGRRIAVLGDMLELGPQAELHHARLAQALLDARVDRLFAAGPLTRHLYEAVPEHMRAHAAAASSTLVPLLAESLRDGDVVMVKGSLGSRMGQIVEALLEANELNEDVMDKTEGGI